MSRRLRKTHPDLAFSYPVPENGPLTPCVRLQSDAGDAATQEVHPHQFSAKSALG
jgi:hypothetical protein